MSTSIGEVETQINDLSHRIRVLNKYKYWLQVYDDARTRVKELSEELFSLGAESDEAQIEHTQSKDKELAKYKYWLTEQQTITRRFIQLYDNARLKVKEQAEQINSLRAQIQNEPDEAQAWSGFTIIQRLEHENRELMKVNADLVQSVKDYKQALEAANEEVERLDKVLEEVQETLTHYAV